MSPRPSPMATSLIFEHYGFDKPHRRGFVRKSSPQVRLIAQGYDHRSHPPRFCPPGLSRAPCPPGLSRAPSPSHRPSDVEQKEEYGRGIEQAAPAAHIRKGQEVTRDADRQRNVEQRQVYVEAAVVGDGQAAQRRQDDGGMGEDHGEDETNEHGVEL